MIVVYHYPLCPFSRKLRFLLTEKNIAYQLKLEFYWLRRESFLTLNPVGMTPLLIDEQGSCIHSNAVFEYIEEQYPINSMIYGDTIEKAKIRMICDWFDNKFYNEINSLIIKERVLSVVEGSNKAPNSTAIRAAKKNLVYHMQYLQYLLKSSNGLYICGNNISMADITAAAHLSVLDYLGDIQWYESNIKQWYAIIKSRPAFRILLQDEINNITPPDYYRDPDF